MILLIAMLNGRTPQPMSMKTVSTIVCGVTGLLLTSEVDIN